jgi:O-acetyl-ADP-ribose deacetylase
VKIETVIGDLLSQQVDAIVNPWNRNIFPWWLLIPQGVSGAIRRKAGTEPFRQLARLPMMALGEAVLTTAGRLPFKGIIHVAGINLAWTATENSVHSSIKNALYVMADNDYKSIAFPTIGAGTGGLVESRSIEIIQQVVSAFDYPGKAVIVILDSGSAWASISVGRAHRQTLELEVIK